MGTGRRAGCSIKTGNREPSAVSPTRFRQGLCDKDDPARTDAGPREFLLALFGTAVSAVDPAGLLQAARLPAPPQGRTVVVGAGKSAAVMAHTLETLWNGPISGTVIVPYGHRQPCNRIEVIEAAHPLPDASGYQSAQRVLEQVRGLTRDDLVLCMLSGGGSALLSLPAKGLTLDDKLETTAGLLRSGATIVEINCVRKHLSAIKGGRLAVAAFPARVETLLVSDVPGDEPSVIASGPTVTDPTTYADALEVLDRIQFNVPSRVRNHLERGARGGSGAPEETPKPGNPHLSRSSFSILAGAIDALDAAAAEARRRGVNPLVLGDSVEGEARRVGEAHGALAKVLARQDKAWSLPCVVLSGGETSVTVRGSGRGGRNTEYLLALALALEGHPQIWALAADTDGIDGSEDNAGAMITPDSMRRAASKRADPITALADNDAYTVFQRLDDLIVTGPTLTNVNDFRAIFIDQRVSGEKRVR